MQFNVSFNVLKQLSSFKVATLIMDSSCSAFIFHICH